MKFLSTWHLSDSVAEIIPKRLEDDRGFFSEVYQENEFKKIGISEYFMQENHSFSKKKFTFRGLHLQKPPYEQAKLVRVIQGSILDIAIDLRVSSPSYLQHIKINLSALNFNQLYIPAGFAHGFLTLEDDCEVVYKVSSPYNHESDVSISAFDEDFQIELPCPNSEILFSEKDANGQSWRSVGEIF